MAGLRFGLVSAVAVALAMAGAAQAGQSEPATGIARSYTPEESEREALRLASLLCAQLRALRVVPADQYEATIVYTLSQQTSPMETQHRALRKLPRVCDLSGAMRTALVNADAALSRGAASGTAGLVGAGGVGNGTSLFSNPLVNVGGGSANYSTAP